MFPVVFSDTTGWAVAGPCETCATTGVSCTAAIPVVPGKGLPTPLELQSLRSPAEPSATMPAAQSDAHASPLVTQPTTRLSCEAESAAPPMFNASQTAKPEAATSRSPAEVERRVEVPPTQVLGAILAQASHSVRGDSPGGQTVSRDRLRDVESHSPSTPGPFVARVDTWQPSASRAPSSSEGQRPPPPPPSVAPPPPPPSDYEAPQRHQDSVSQRSETPVIPLRRNDDHPQSTDNKYSQRRPSRAYDDTAPKTSYREDRSPQRSYRHENESSPPVRPYSPSKPVPMDRGRSPPPRPPPRPPRSSEGGWRGQQRMHHPQERTSRNPADARWGRRRS